MTAKKMNYWGVVPAAGIGSRMGAGMPKQYLSLAGRPIIERTLARLAACGLFSQLVVSIHPEDRRWPEVKQPPTVPVLTVTGGAERCHSVFNALQALADRAEPHDWVLVHDVARPCVRPADIRHLAATLDDHPVGGLLGVPVADTMKRTDAGGVIRQTVERCNLWHAYTPQMFRFDRLYAALERALASGVTVTDEASAIEWTGQQPLMVAGHRDNIKITHPDDLQLAEIFLQAQAVSDTAE